MDECAELEHVCTNGVCVNTPGGFNCRCDPGYEISETGDECSGKSLWFVSIFTSTASNLDAQC